MKFLNRLHGRRVPPGLEWEILRKLPRITFAGLLVPLALAIFVRILPVQQGVDAAYPLQHSDRPATGPAAEKRPD